MKIISIKSLLALVSKKFANSENYFLIFHKNPSRILRPDFFFMSNQIFMDFTRHFVSMYHQDRVFKRRPATIDATETSSIEEIEIDDTEISEQGVFQLKLKSKSPLPIQTKAA